jgi:hypothetical protein
MNRHRSPSGHRSENLNVALMKDFYLEPRPRYRKVFNR